MPSPTTSSVTPQDVARLVSEVISRIRSESKAAAQPAAAAVAAVTLTDRVVSAEILERLPARTTQVQLPQRAVITPSARDVARDRGISLLPASARSVATTGRPLIIARADCRDDISALTAHISRAVPASQQIPTAGLTSVLMTLADHAGRDAARGLLLTDKPAVACVAANRHGSLRAVTADNAASLEAAASACAANLLVIEPGRFSVPSLERMAAAFARRETTAPPAVLSPPAPATTPVACSCQHSH
jgi:hypothetical protein